MIRMIFVRHGETLWNQELRYQGQQDSPLSPAGIRQAQKVGEFLSEREVDAVYSSDLKRALFTAQTIARHHHINPSVDQRLREMSFGLWEGLTREEVVKRYPELWSARLQNSLETRIPDGELPGEVVTRFQSFLQECTAKDEGQTIVVVSHGAALRLVIASLLHIPLGKSYCLHQSNTGISELLYCSWEALCINCTAHLNIFSSRKA